MADSRALENDQKALEVVAAVGSAVLGVAAGLVTDSAGGLVIGAAVNQPLRSGLERVAGLRGRQAALMYEVACQAANESHDQLLARVIADPHRQQLLWTAVRASADTALEAKLRAVGRRLAAGLMAPDDDGVGVQRVIIETLGDLELPHWQTLDQMTRRYEGYGQPRDDTGRSFSYGWTMKALQDHLPSLTPILGAVIPVLLSRGLIAGTALGSIGYDGAPEEKWVVTNFGHGCLAELQERGRRPSG
jgi:hypothetical protein